MNFFFRETEFVYLCTKIIQLLQKCKSRKLPTRFQYLLRIIVRVITQPSHSPWYVQDFLIRLDMKPCMHLVEISIFSLNLVIVRLTKNMNRANKNWAQFQKIKYLKNQNFQKLCPFFVGSAHNFGLTRFCEKMLISTRCIHGFMSNLIKKSWMDSNMYIDIQENIVENNKV